jgi:hypothetical protein
MKAISKQEYEVKVRLYYYNRCFICGKRCGHKEFCKEHRPKEKDRGQA